MTSRLKDGRGDLVRAGGRVVLWAVLLVVLARGLGAIFGGEHDRTAGVAGRPAAGFPDAEARAVAARFARAYLSVSPGGDQRRDRVVAGLLADGLSDRAAPVVPRRSPGARVAWATVAREDSLGDSRALITVAVFFDDGRARDLTVPVARDRDGGLVVFDLPYFTAPPARAQLAADEPVALPDEVAGPVGGLAERFLRLYVEGAPRSELAYLLAPGSRVDALAAGLSLVAVDEVGEPPGTVQTGGHRTVLASVRVRDEATGAVYPLRYRLRVTQRDRWYVAAVEGGRR